jgi:hypothetical protein
MNAKSGTPKDQQQRYAIAQQPAPLALRDQQETGL